MASDYDAIRADNERRYGTDVDRYGKSLLTDLYDDRTHFIYELLQNAEDALRRRTDEPQSRTVRFDLSGHALRITHYGKPFDQRDVEGVCGIAMSTAGEDLTRIGRFGIGFKSVYGFTDRPEIHSGDEDFGIDSFVWPSAAQPIERGPDQTVFVMPLCRPDEDGEEIANGLRGISLDTLLFLREIEAIEWILPDGESGTYVRQTNNHNCHVRLVTVIGESTDQGYTEKIWQVFSRPMYMGPDIAGHIEVAFLMEDDCIVPVFNSPLVVFFPTAVETNLGFRVQGPYRTTPSRDNLPKSDAWNQKCVEKTGDVLVDALVWLRDRDLLDVNVLQCLPIDKHKFDDDSMFASLYESVKDALRAQDLLPMFGGGYTTTASVKLARSQELRELFDRDQIACLFKREHSMSWLTDVISQDRTPNLRKYLMEDLGIDEITPQMILSRLSTSFLQRQNHEWMCRLYKFLKGQVALHQQAKNARIIRLSDGTHVPAFVDGAPHAFLPGSVKTDFPTVHEETCRSADAEQFLRTIGLSEPDPVDNVIRNVLPKYDKKNLRVSDSRYAEDISRILAASRTKASDKRGELIQHLRQTRFVRAVSAANGAACFAAPDGLYLATDRLKALFASIPDIHMVDDSCSALRGDDIRDLLESCGAVRHLLPVKKEYRIQDCPLPGGFLATLREKSGHAETSNRNDTVTDWILNGLDDILERLPYLDVKDRRSRAKYVWEELIQVEDRRGKSVFRAEYFWTHYGDHRQGFDSFFVRNLNDRAWVPDQNGKLRQPRLILFKSLGWRDDPFLLSKIRFKTPIVDQLAVEAGLEPEMLNLLIERGITSVADLKKLGLLDDDDNGASAVNSVEDALNALGVPGSEGPETDDQTLEPSQNDLEGGGGSSTMPGAYGRPSNNTGYRRSGFSEHTRQRRPTSASNPGSAPFISYVAVDRESGADDPDGLDHKGRMVLEEAAIALIQSREQDWQRTRTHNPGFDLFKVADGQPRSWCEVKAMKGSLQGRPVGLSRTQFECARKRGADYWLYVVERAGGKDARIVRIQDPAGKAKTFTFDKGWLDVAELG